LLIKVMPGQLSNFMRNIGKYLVNPIMNGPLWTPTSEVAGELPAALASINSYDPTFVPTFAGEVLGEIGGVAGKLAGAAGVGYNIYSNLSKLDDPTRSAFDKGLDIAKASVAPVAVASLLPGTLAIPGAGWLAAGTIAGIDAANYFGEVSEGRADAPPAPENVRMNPLASMANKVVNSGGFKDFWRNFGNNWGINIR
jgi:hypothetical protein